MLASGGYSLVDHLGDHPWPGCELELFGMKVVWMSSGIASMLLVGGLLIAVILFAASRRQSLPNGGYNVLEVLTVFVRDMIAKPALGENAYAFLPMLLTLFIFIFSMNLIGLIPLSQISQWLGGVVPFMEGRPIGVTPTGILTVCGGLAAMVLCTILLLGLKATAVGCHEHTRWPIAVCVVISPLLWLKSLAPGVGGVTGAILLVPMILLEMVSLLAKCFALMIRLFANMTAGHALLAVMMMFIVMALEKLVATGAMTVTYVGPICIIASVLIDFMELVVAGLQAYIFTLLTAVFLGLYVHPEH